MKTQLVILSLVLAIVSTALVGAAHAQTPVPSSSPGWTDYGDPVTTILPRSVLAQCQFRFRYSVPPQGPGGTVNNLYFENVDEYEGYNPTNSNQYYTALTAPISSVSATLLVSTQSVRVIEPIGNLGNPVDDLIALSNVAEIRLSYATYAQNGPANVGSAGLEILVNNHTGDDPLHTYSFQFVPGRFMLQKKCN